MSKNNTKSLSVKLSNLDVNQRHLIDKWIDEIKLEKKSINSEVQKILIEHLHQKMLKKDLERTLDIFENSIFYAFRKSSFASLSPYQANVKFWFDIQNIEIDIINKKLDIILNLLAESGNININSPKDKWTKEADYFKRTRQESVVKVSLERKEILEETKATLKRFKNFKDVAFDDTEDFIERMKGEFD